MKNLGCIVGIVLVAICGILVAMGVRNYNSMVTLQNEVDTSWSNVETVYQTRADLIPNLVEIVKGYAAHESNTLQAVTDARAKVGSITLSADSLSEETLKKFSEAQNQLSGAMKSLLAVTEAYPDLKANESFLKLQDEYSGMERQVKYARMQYNEKAKEYNTAIAKFPANLFAGFFGFQKKPYFSASEGAENAPAVKF